MQRTDAESEPEARHKRKKRKRDRADSRSEKGRPEYKLLLYAALGDVSKVRKILDRHPSVNLNVFDAEGNTPLHQAGRHGHRELVTLLLRYGADAKAEDLRGNTPAHLAASRGDLRTLALLLQADPPPNIDARNITGDTVRELAALAMARSDHASSSGSGDFPRMRPQRPASPDWGARLAEEVSDNEADEDEWASFGSTCFGAGLPHDEDAYAQRIWQEMERRKQQRHFASAARQPEPGFVGPLLPNAEQTSHAKRKAEAAAEARARSDKILEEEKARDAAWRRAVAKGDLGTRRAQYEAKWHLFAAAALPGIGVNDIPWIADNISVEECRDVVLYGTTGTSEPRKRLRQELMRWHPDKFESRFGSRLHPSQRTAVLERVKAISQMLNTLSSSL